MNTISKLTKVVKSAARVTTYVAVAGAVVYLAEKVIPSDDDAKAIALAVGFGLLAHTIAYQATNYIDDVMQGEVVHTVLFGKEGTENY